MSNVLERRRQNSEEIFPYCERAERRERERERDFDIYIHIIDQVKNLVKRRKSNELSKFCPIITSEQWCES